MPELSGQLFSTKVQNLADGSAGHNNESTQNEITWDNPIDVGATNIDLITCKENLCWAILDNGPGMTNIENLTGAGKGTKIKSLDKIGNKIQGEFASAIFYEPTELMYFSRTHEIRSEFNFRNRKHQQLNLLPHDIVKLVREKDADLSEVDVKINKGSINSKRYLHLPEPSIDVFDNYDVAYVKTLFKNNEKINEYFDTDKTGLLKVFIYKSDNLTRYDKLVSEISNIIDKNEFITYNTVKGCLKNITFTHIDVDSGHTRVVNSDSCHNNFILGKDALCKDEDDIEDENEDYIETSTFGILNIKKVMSITCDIYNKGTTKYAACNINNFDDLQEFWVSDKNSFQHSSKCKTEDLNKIKAESLNKIGEVELLLSCISENEATAQFNIMSKLNPNIKNDDLKSDYVYCNGRFLNMDKIPCEKGIFERNLPNFRIISCFNSNSKCLIGVQSQKSAINLKLSDPIYLSIIEKLVKPIINEYGSGVDQIKDPVKHSLNGKIRTTGIVNWDDEKLRIINIFKNDISAAHYLSLTKSLLPATQVPAPVITTTATPTTATTATTATSVTTATTATTATSVTTAAPISAVTTNVPVGVVPTPQPPSSRGPAPIVLAQLNKQQTVAQLKRIEVELRKPNSKYKSRSEKSKLFTKFINIAKEIILDDDDMPALIEFVTEVVSLSEKPNNVKNAAVLQEI